LGFISPCPDRRSEGAHSPSARGTEAPAPGPRPRRITSGETSGNAAQPRWFRGALRDSDGWSWAQRFKSSPGRHYPHNFRYTGRHWRELWCNRETQGLSPNPSGTGAGGPRLPRGYKFRPQSFPPSLLPGRSLAESKRGLGTRWSDAGLVVRQAA